MGELRRGQDFVRASLHEPADLQAVSRHGRSSALDPLLEITGMLGQEGWAPGRGIQLLMDQRLKQPALLDVLPKSGVCQVVRRFHCWALLAR